MSIIQAEQVSSEVRVIRIVGRFDVATRSEFCMAYETEPGTTREFNVDLGKASHIDSAALGMLMLLREYATERDAQVCLLRPRTEAGEVLELARFERYFEIRDVLR